MTAAIANLALNVLMVALLVATIAYCWLLNRRIQMLQDSKGELANLMRHFDESTQRASDSIMALQNASKKIGETMQSRIDKANFMLDDLSFMIEKGNKLANQLEASLAVGRARSKVMAQEPKAPVMETHDDQQDVQWLEEDLMPQSIKPVAATNGAPRSQPERAPTAREQQNIKEKTAASLGAVLERLGNRMSSGSRLDSARPKPTRMMYDEDGEEMMESPVSGQSKPRSKVEQELLEILRAGVKG